MSQVSHPSIVASQSEALQEAFSEFSLLSAQLENSYRALQNKVSELTEELAATRSDRLRQLAEKERLADRLETLLGAMPAAVLVIDADGYIQSCNPAALQLFGKSLVDLNWKLLLSEHLAEFSGDELTLKNGRVLSFSTRTLDSEPGRIIVLSDVTRSRELQAAANRQLRLASMGQMVASLAHQLRTPLSSAVLYASQLSHPALDEAGKHRSIEKIRGSLRHLECLVNDMLMFAKGGEFSESLLSLNDLIDAFRERVEPRMQQAGAKLTIQAPSHGYQIQGSLDALVSVLVNLADNALDAWQERADAANNALCEIKLRMTQQNQTLVFSLGDNGPGIPGELRSRIFEPFYTTRSRGTGLGLAVARAIAQAHQGDLKLQSGDESGCVFQLSLPIVAHDQLLPSGADTALYTMQTA